MTLTPTGVVRAGFACDTTADEVDRWLDGVRGSRAGPRGVRDTRRWP
ncbi:MAG TPA: hypothetical protein VF516_30015 [Kofleriaceae bacterium]